MSFNVGVSPAEDKHNGIVVPTVHAVNDPQTHVYPVQILSCTEGDPHRVANPHVQLPAEQVSEFPLHVTLEHGSEKNNKFVKYGKIRRFFHYY